MQRISTAWQRLCIAILLSVVALPLVAQRGRKIAPQRKTTIPAMRLVPAERVPAVVSGVSAQDSATAYALYLSAIVQREKGQTDAMYELLTRAVQLNPNLSAAYYLLATPMHLLYPTSPDSVAHVLQRAVALEPYNRDYLEALAKHYADIEQIDDALALYERLIALGGNTVPYLGQLYTLQARTARYSEALATLDKLTRLEGDNEEMMMQRIKLYTALEREADAVALMDSLIATHPGNADYVGYKALYYIQTNQADEALRIAEKGLAKDSTNALLLRSTIAAYGLLGDQKRSAEATYRYLSLPTEDYLPRLLPVLKYTEEGDTAMQAVLLRVLSESFPRVEDKPALAEIYTAYLDARVHDDQVQCQHLKTIVHAVPEYTQARLMLLGKLMRDTVFAEATALCDEGIAYSPEHPVFYYYKGIFLSQAGLRREALATLRQGAPLLHNPAWHTDLVSDYYGIYGDLLYQHGERKAGWQALDSALVYNGTNAMVLNNYAYYLYLDKKRTDAALQMSEKAATLESENCYYIDTYIDLLLYTKAIDTAQRVVDDALKRLATKEVEALHLLWEDAGDVAYLRGDKDTALKYWQEAQKSGSDSPTLLKKIAQKRYLRQSKKEALKQ